MVLIEFKLTKNGSEPWCLTGEEYRDGDLVGASDVTKSCAADVVAIINMVLADYE